MYFLSTFAQELQSFSYAAGLYVISGAKNRDKAVFHQAGLSLFWQQMKLLSKILTQPWKKPGQREHQPELYQTGEK